jgi:hypothetical protein
MTAIQEVTRLMIAERTIQVCVQTELYNVPNEIGAVMSYIIVDGVETKIGHTHFSDQNARVRQENIAYNNAKALAEALGCAAIAKETIQ